jgi:hypothetical protein
MRTLISLAALTFLAQPGVFEVELWPGEGRPQFQVFANELAIRETPSSSARIVRRVRMSRGQSIAFDETRYRTIVPGHLQVLATSAVGGRNLGAIHSLSRDAYYRGGYPRQRTVAQLHRLEALPTYPGAVAP